MLKNITDMTVDEMSEEQEESYYDPNNTEPEETLLIPIPVTEDLSSQITMLTSFDCWVGHTNFDITPSVRDALEEIAGVEVLVILTRYRFFIGIGRMLALEMSESRLRKKFLVMAIHTKQKK